MGRRYPSPVVKHELSKLAKDAENRRSALFSLRQMVGQLDPGWALPRFLAQFCDARGESHTHSICLYEDLATSHGTALLPHLPTLMGSLKRALLASSAHPFLIHHCSKATVALARAGSKSPTHLTEMMRGVCNPLMEALSVKIEPLSMGAAMCLLALVECEDVWRTAPPDLVGEICFKVTMALENPLTQTVAHLQLASALAAANPATLGNYGVTLLEVGATILTTVEDGGGAGGRGKKGGGAISWQHRCYSARLLQSVMLAADESILTLELGRTIEALSSCRHDRMPLVRQAVIDALSTARSLHGGANEPNYELAATPQPPTKIVFSVENETNHENTPPKPAPLSPSTLNMKTFPIQTNTNESLKKKNSASHYGSLHGETRLPLYPISKDITHHQSAISDDLQKKSVPSKLNGSNSEGYLDENINPESSGGLDDSLPASVVLFNSIAHLASLEKSSNLKHAKIFNKETEEEALEKETVESSEHLFFQRSETLEAVVEEEDEPLPKKKLSWDDNSTDHDEDEEHYKVKDEEKYNGEDEESPLPVYNTEIEVLNLFCEHEVTNAEEGSDMKGIVDYDKTLNGECNMQHDSRDSHFPSKNGEDLQKESTLTGIQEAQFKFKQQPEDFEEIPLEENLKNFKSLQKHHSKEEEYSIDPPFDKEAPISEPEICLAQEEEKGEVLANIEEDTNQSGQSSPKMMKRERLDWFLKLCNQALSLLKTRKNIQKPNTKAVHAIFLVKYSSSSFICAILVAVSILAFLSPYLITEKRHSLVPT